MKKKTLPELEKELSQHERAVAVYEKKIYQLENRLSKSQTRYNKSKRNARTHRLCNIGGFFESLIPNADTLTNEQVMQLISVALNSEQAKDFLRNVDLKSSQNPT